MSRYIDADKLQQAYKEIHGGKRSLLIDTEPTADVRENVQLDVCPLYGGACGYPSGECYDCPRHGNFRENVKGEWISHDLENGEKSIDKDCCSVCGERFREIAMTGYEWNFCPNCGAEMRSKS